MNAPVRVVLTPSERAVYCRSCGTNVFGKPNRCTCTFVCMTCRSESVGKPNHALDESCPGA